MVEGALEVVERRRNEQPASQLVLSEARELRQALQRQMQFRCESAGAEMRHAPSEASVQIFSTEQAQKRCLRIDIRDHSICRYDVTRGELNPGGTMRANDDALDSGARSDLDSGRCGCCRERA